MTRFAEPWYLLMLFGLPLWWWLRRRMAKPNLIYPSVLPLTAIRPARFGWLRHAGLSFRLLTLTALVLGLARPIGGGAASKKTSEGLDIALVLDTSGSMAARDFVLNDDRPTRLAVIKQVISDFIKDRPSDRIGIVVFGSEAFTQAPLTLDHQVLQKFVDRIEIGMAGEATAIGNGLVTAVNRLKDVKAKSKVAILLTDGANNAGRADPIAAANAAKVMGVKVYTIGVGSNGEVPIEVNGRMILQKFDLDEALLTDISKRTGGQYFRAADTETLVKVYETIDQLEKTKVEVESFETYDDRFQLFAWIALGGIIGEAAFALTRFRSIPS